MKSTTYTFGPFLMSPEKECLWREGKLVNLSPKVFALLCEVVKHRGDVVSKDTLMSVLWAESFVGESSLSQTVFLLRKALGRTEDGSEYIETLSKRGYRLTVPVEVQTDKPAPAGQERGDGEDGPGKPETAAALPLPETKASLNRLPGPTERDAPQETAPARAFSRWTWKSGAAAAVLLLGALVFYSSGRLFRKDHPRVLRFTRLSNDGLYKERLIPLLSDGERVYFSEIVNAGSYLADVSVGGGETLRREAPGPGYSALSYSSQKKELLLGSLWETSPDRPMLAVSLPDGTSHPLTGLSGHAASWSPRGDRIALAKDRSLFIADPENGKTREIAHMADAIYWPRWSPDGTRIRFSLLLSGLQPVLWEVRADGTNLHAVFPREPWANRACCGDWTVDGRYYVFVVADAQRSSLWSAPDTQPWWNHGEPAQLADGPVDFWRAPLVSRDGKHIYALGEQARGELVKFDTRSQGFHPGLLDNLSTDTLSFSRDGQWVAYTLFPEGTLWRSRLDGTERLRLTDGPGIARFPQWSPDGRQILYITAGQQNLWQVHKILASGGKSESVLPDKTNQGVATWSADGQHIAFGQLVSFGVDAPRQSIRVMDLSSGKASTLPGSAGLWTARWSPDGRYLSAVTTDNRKLMLYDFSRNTWTELADIGTNDVVWSPASDAILFDSPDNPGVYRVEIQTRKVRRLCSLEGIRRTGFYGWSLNVAPDGEPLLLREAGIHEVYSLDVTFP